MSTNMLSSTNQDNNDFNSNSTGLIMHNSNTIDERNDEEFIDNGEYTPGRTNAHTKIVKEWIPTCEEHLKPKIGMEFESLDEGENFIRNMLIMLDLVFESHLVKRATMVRRNIKYLFATKKVLKSHLTRGRKKEVSSVHRVLFKSYTHANIGASKAHLNPSFYFAYEIDDDSNLNKVFCADGISRKNYALYGDVMTFDTTYDTNRYKMIFAPFTGLDNHRLCVSFGAAFLADEKNRVFYMVV
ncbi:Protein FAR1-RELATED SEQUENCE 3 [Bienertia sinuspersici]